LAAERAQIDPVTVVTSPLAEATDPHSLADFAADSFLVAISRDFALRHGLLGIVEENEAILLYAEDAPPDARWNTRVHWKRSLKCESLPREREISGEGLRNAIDASYEAHASVLGSIEAESGTGEAGDLPIDGSALADRDLLSTDGKAAVAQLVDRVLLHASRARASDVHIQPLEDRLIVRIRIDGVLQNLKELPSSLAAPITSRIKVLGSMDIAEQRVPQDGRATVKVGSGRSIDLRISSMPTSFGERVVLRLLESSESREHTSLSALGMPSEVEVAYRERAGRSTGVILLTGPTGSGKTTTLYATLRWIAARGSGELNVMTVEDPIEYQLSTDRLAISQSQVNNKKGVTFATGLRHILRQDPDVVMVGEIRDSETARTAIQASLTGHLVFSTLHTNDAASAVARLIDLGAEPYLVASSLSAVLAQRLVRRMHRECQGGGCETCLQTGYLGRTGLFELLLVDERIRELVSTGGSTDAIRRAALGAGMRLLEDDGARLVESGVTTEDEVRRVAIGVVS